MTIQKIRFEDNLGEIWELNNVQDGMRTISGIVTFCGKKKKWLGKMVSIPKTTITTVLATY